MPSTTSSSVSGSSTTTSSSLLVHPPSPALLPTVAPPAASPSASPADPRPTDDRVPHLSALSFQSLLSSLPAYECDLNEQVAAWMESGPRIPRFLCCDDEDEGEADE